MPNGRPGRIVEPRDGGPAHLGEAETECRRDRGEAHGEAPPETGGAETEAAIKEETKVTIRCIPLPGQGPDPEPGACIKSGRPSAQRVLFAKAY